MRPIAFLLFLAPLFAADLSPDQQQRVLEKVRAYSESYGDRLRNFTCIKVTARSVDTSGSGKNWKDVDVQEQELTYIAHRESYKLLKITGARAAPYTTMRGEFQGLPHLFDPRARVEFTWDHAEGSTCVLRYRAGLESGAAIHYNSGGKQGALPHHGFIYADCTSGTVSRLRMEADPQKGKLEAVQSDITYGPVSIGGKEFILPLTADDMARNGKTTTKATVRFTNYKKYDADTTIHFDREN